jgi:hypothetical protein
MSTKNLARTVIEGGRYRGNRWFRRYSNQQERAAERQLSSRLARLEVLEDAVYKPRQPLWREFHDKLAPGKRWLRSQVGRPWHKVRGELLQRFDPRTTAGRHIVFDHLIPWVEVTPTAFSWAPFEVDRHGFLREVARKRQRGGVKRLPERESVLLGWLGTRRVGERDAHLYWFVPTATGAFRQASPLDEEDAVRWRSLPTWFREQWDAFVPHAPGRKD